MRIILEKQTGKKVLFSLKIQRICKTRRGKIKLTFVILKIKSLFDFLE